MDVGKMPSLVRESLKGRNGTPINVASTSGHFGGISTKAHSCEQLDRVPFLGVDLLGLDWLAIVSVSSIYRDP